MHIEIRKKIKEALESTVSKPVLYHVPPSFYSQIARLAFVETHVNYDSVYALPGPPS